MTEPKTPPLPRLLYLAAVLAAMLAGACFRLLPLAHESMWFDELFSRHIASEPWSVAFADICNDLVHPPLYYVLLKTIAGFAGLGTLAVRSFSLVCGLAGIPAIAWVGAKLPSSRWTGLLAAACMAAGQPFVYYSQEARSYAFYALLVLCFTAWLQSLDAKEHGWRVWLPGLAWMTALVYTHYVGAVFVAVAALAFLFSQSPLRSRVRLFLAAVAAALLFLPWLLVEIGVYRNKHGLGQNLGWQDRPHLADLKMFYALSLGIPPFPGMTTAVLAVGAVLLAGLLVLLLRDKRSLAGQTAIPSIFAMAVAPPILLYLVAQPPLNLPIFDPRHLLPSLTLLLLLACYGLERICQALPRPQARLCAAAGVAALIALSAAPTLAALSSGPMRYPYAAIARQVQSEQAKGVASYAASDFLAIPVNYACASSCIQMLPQNTRSLPGKVALFYRPRVPQENGAYTNLLQSGYRQTGEVRLASRKSEKSGPLLVELESGGAASGR